MRGSLRPLIKRLDISLWMVSATLCARCIDTVQISLYLSNDALVNIYWMAKPSVMNEFRISIDQVDFSGRQDFVLYAGEYR